jgi:surface protein
MFQNSIPGGSVSSWNTANVVNMKNVFNSSQTSLSQFATSWNVSKVTNMEGMFFASGLYNANLSTWNVSKVTNMKNMFSYNGDGSTVNYTLDNWDVSEVTTMEGMFENTRFNGNITRWDTQAVSNMNSMFRSNNLFAQDLTGWCVSLIPTIPTNFGGNTGWTTKPGWGTCPLSLSIRPQFTLTADVWNVQYLAPSSISSAFTPALSATLDANPITFIASTGQGPNTGFTLYSPTATGTIDVDWGDGVRETFTMTTAFRNITHTYTNLARTSFSIVTLYNKSSTIAHIEMYDFNANFVALTNWGAKNNWNKLKLRDSGITFVPTAPIPTTITTAEQMFRSCRMNDVRLKYWNVSNITDMSAMFSQNGGNGYFNQDLSKWCVSSIPTKPSFFDSIDTGPNTVWTQPQPVWGTCPSMPSINRMPKNIELVAFSRNGLLTTSNSKFGSSCFNTGTNGGNAAVSPDPDFAFENRNFTIEMFVNPANFTGIKTYWDNRLDENSPNSIRIDLDGSTLKYIVNGVTLISGTYTASANTWAHIAVSRSGTSTRLFVNGVQLGSTLTDTNVYRTGIVWIGGTHRGAQFAGLIDEVRVSKSARYTANFTPATSAFTNDSNTVLLLHFEGANGSKYTEDDIS